MDASMKIVANFYTSERAIKEFKDNDAHQLGLKIWEKDVVAKFFPHNASILDIGCGTGREAFCLYDMGFSMTATDISERTIEMAEQFAVESGRNIEFLLTNGLELPFENNAFDIVIMWAQTFGLFYERKNKLRILKECHRVLKSDGVISFSGHNKAFIEQHHPQYADGKKFFAYADTDCYWELFTVSEMETLAKASGFTVLDCQSGAAGNESENPIIHCECRK